MKLILTLLCRNESDIIDSTIRFHLSQGVDFIIATDNGSTDGSVDILKNYEKRGVLQLISEPEHNHDQGTWVTRMAEMASNDHGADWIIHCDADEFWYPALGSLKRELGLIPPECLALAIKRVNFLPARESSGHSEAFYEMQTIREVNSLNHFGTPLPAKICHRPMPGVRIGDGNHSIWIGDSRVSTGRLDDIEILHFPVRSFQQFERKIRDGAEALNRNTRISKLVGATWRNIYDVYYRTNTLHSYYQGLCPTKKTIEDGLKSGLLVEDLRLLQALGKSPQP